MYLKLMKNRSINIHMLTIAIVAIVNLIKNHFQNNPFNYMGVFAFFAVVIYFLNVVGEEEKS